MLFLVVQDKKGNYDANGRSWLVSIILFEVLSAAVLNGLRARLKGLGQAVAESIWVAVA